MCMYLCVLLFHSDQLNFRFWPRPSNNEKYISFFLNLIDRIIEKEVIQEILNMCCFRNPLLKVCNAKYANQKLFRDEIEYLIEMCSEYITV